MRWQGKKLSEYSKNELVLIVEALMRITEEQARRHVRELEDLFDQEVG
jgi:hypothetical protein